MHKRMHAIVLGLLAVDTGAYECIGMIDNRLDTLLTRCRVHRAVLTVWTPQVASGCTSQSSPHC